MMMGKGKQESVGTIEETGISAGTVANAGGLKPDGWGERYKQREGRGRATEGGCQMAVLNRHSADPSYG